MTPYTFKISNGEWPLALSPEIPDFRPVLDLPPRPLLRRLRLPLQQRRVRAALLLHVLEHLVEVVRLSHSVPALYPEKGRKKGCQMAIAGF